MQILKTFLYRLLPTSAEEALFRKFAGCCRFVWNRFLMLQKETYVKEGHYLDYYSLNNLLNEWKKNPALSFLNDMQSQILQQTIRDLTQARYHQSKAVKDFSYKRKYRDNSFRYPQWFKIDSVQNKIYLPKIGWVKFQSTRILEGTPKQLTVSGMNGQWYASLLTKVDVGKPKPLTSEIVRIDMGSEDVVACLSDGTMVALPEDIRKYEERQRRFETQLKRMVPHSGHWQKQKALLEKEKNKIFHVCDDHLHKITKDLCARYCVAIITERADAQASSVNEKSSEKRPSGIPLPSLSNSKEWYNCRHGLYMQRAKREFLRQLQYKMQWCGGKIVKVPPTIEEQNIFADRLVTLARRRKANKVVERK